MGHSLGGMVIPLVASQRPARALVFLCGVVPLFGGTPWDEGPPMERPGFFDDVVAHPDGSRTWGTLAGATAAFYGHCTPGDAAWAFERLRPLNSASLWDRPYPLNGWPPCDRISIAADDDAGVTVDWSRHAARSWLGVEPIVLPGDHSPFLSRPEDLADVLDRIASGDVDAAHVARRTSHQ